MFDYQVSKHPHFDEACRAFALRHNLVQLAERAGMNDFWQGRRDSNSQHPVLETGALPIELRP